MQTWEWIAGLTVAGLVLAALWKALRPQRVFTLSIASGSVRATGTVPRGFVHEVEQVCREANVDRGEVRGVRRGRAIGLAFHGPIPADCRQRLRNLWQVHALRL